MSGAVVFVDASRAGRSDPAPVAQALSIDAYRARLLLNARVPFLARGFPSVVAAAKVAGALEEAGLPASAHAPEAVGRVPRAFEPAALSRRNGSYVFTGAGNRSCEVPFAALRSVVHARLTVHLELPGPAAAIPPARWVPSGSARVAPAAPVHYWRLDVFAEPRPGECARIAVRHDRFDFSCLLERKTLSAVRNLAALREEIARARPGADVPVDDSFEKTELARDAFAPDAWSEVDLRTGAVRAIPARSNRAAFEGFAAIRFLHDRRRVPETADHFYEL